MTDKQMQEPVAWGVFEGGNLHDMFFSKEEAEHMALLKGSHAEVRPLYTTPPAQPTPADGQLIWILWAFIVLMLSLLTLRSCL
jgi:hypothetical protein